ncbi:hydroxyacylglutathione hydrolase [Alcanivorax sp. 1008]|uniref:hydroxyacylglutathione hydrolase n=1 Tax=Alcanivorax sp. 1008 TaxID=2816853 RepID=UPI001D929C74|nr:hydroxyacylglutathione hydrolase [Alcanivorax sp. 1008]MCC1496402.1 hydroxyacylglutathione hydrolase [Alcanivorax sp. 1008]
MLSVIAIPAFQDNYIWLIHDSAGNGVVVDPGDAAPVMAALDRLGVTLRAILITHHHPDHTAGIDALTECWPVPVYGPKQESIRGVTMAVDDGDQVILTEPSIRLDVIAVPGHTLGHVAYYTVQPDKPLLFCGDTLFSGGCGRLFEGSPAQMLASLDRLSELPEQTLIYCTHEYTTSNLAFARSILPSDPALIRRQQQVSALRDADQPSLPSTLAEELRSNLFLRCHEADLQAALNDGSTEPTDRLSVFTALRTKKDHF